MRFALFAFALALLPACTLEPGADGVRVHPRLPYTSSTKTIAENEPWSGEPIRVQVEHGNVQVVGLRSAKGITVRATMYTWADDPEDAGAMEKEILAGLTVSREDGRFVVHCAEPERDVRSALANASQCNVRVEVPAPEGAVHDVEAYAIDGFTYLRRLATNAHTSIRATGIEIEGFDLRGNVSLHAGWLDAEVEPIAGARIEIESTTDDWYYVPSLAAVPKRSPRDGAAEFGATLRLPRDFRAQRVELSSAGASVEAFAFPDVVSGAPRGPVDASAAALVAVRANQGNATLLPLGETFSSVRHDEFGSDTRDPWGSP